MKWLVIVLAVGCAPGERTPPAGPDGSAPPPDAPMRTDGIWEPDPGMGRSNVDLVSDGADIWFTYGRVPEAPMPSHVWLTKTSSSGDVLVAPFQVDADTNAWPLAIARSGDNVAVLWRASAANLRLYSPAGVPLQGAPTSTSLVVAGMTYATDVALVGRPDGSMRMFVGYEGLDSSTEVEMHDFDSTGSHVGDAVQFGSADGGVPSDLAGAVEASGSTLLAWDRQYDECQGQFDPDATIVTPISTDGAPGAMTDIDPAGRSDREPTLAASGSSAYVAWTADTDAGSIIRIARASAPSEPLAQVGNPALGNATPRLAMADDSRGAVAWITAEPTVRVASLRDDGTTVSVGPPHVISLGAVGRISLNGLVHVGDDRYLVAWTEESYTASRARLFAYVVDVSLAPGPEPVAPSHPLVGGGSRRCSH